MARFLAAIQGSRGEATRLGGESSGVRAQAQGWTLGVKVYGHAEDDGNDSFSVSVTRGSSGWDSGVQVLEVFEQDGRRYVRLGEALTNALSIPPISATVELP
jgi:hypothetical protein